MKNTYIRIFLICCLGALLTNCEAEDGTPGLAGNFGVSGANGADGTNGVDGADGLEIDELDEYGSITITVDGVRSDGVAFTDVINEFKYTGTNLDETSNYVEIEESSYRFYLERFLGSPDYSETYGTYTYLAMDVNDPGEETESLFFEFGMDGFYLVFEDQKFVSFNEYLETDDTDATSIEVSNYSFDEDTNNLTLSVAAVMDPDEYDDFTSLTITIDVDVTVQKEAENDIRR